MDRLNLTCLSVWIPIVAPVTGQSCIVASAVKLTKLKFLKNIDIYQICRVILCILMLVCQSLLYSQLFFWNTFKVHKPSNSNLNDINQMLGDIKKLSTIKTVLICKITQLNQADPGLLSIIVCQKQLTIFGNFPEIISIKDINLYSVNLEGKNIFPDFFCSPKIQISIKMTVAYFGCWCVKDIHIPGRRLEAELAD